ncbi:MAG: FtsQ-type POTRA domain-containing protein [Nitrospira sp.]|nr:FtsQ-type POTRA domain-containing protein [Nitrospira sp.]
MGETLSRHAEAKRAKTAAKRMTFLRRSGAVIAVALAGWAVVLGVQHSGPFLARLLEIHEVTVEGVHRIDKQEVLDLIKLKPGTSLHHVVLSGIEARIESHPWIKKATAARVPFHELHIAVIERTPTAVVRAGSENFLSDAEGHVLGTLAQTDDDSLPLVTGVDRKGLLRGDEAIRQTIISGIELAKLVGETYEGRLQINAANPENLVASVRGVRFYFGEGSVGDQWDRFQRVKPAVKTLAFDESGDGANDVDLRYENRVVVRERG